MIQEGIINFFYEYNIILAFVAGLAIGDLMIILGVLSGAGKVNFFLIVAAAFVGGIIHDSFLYLVANTKMIYKLKKKFKLSKKRSKIARFIEKIGNGHYFLPVLIAKFVYGVRDAVLIYIAHNHKNFKKFLLVVALADLIWILTITSVGWLAGRGFELVLSAFKGFEKLLFVGVVTVIIIHLLNKFVITFIMKFIRKKLKIKI